MMQDDDELPVPRWNYTSFWDAKEGKEMIRANFWGKDGHSTKTHLTVGEAKGWIETMKARGTKSA